MAVCCGADMLATKVGGSQAGDHAATGGGDTSGRSECLVLGYASFGVLN